MTGHQKDPQIPELRRTSEWLGNIASTGTSHCRSPAKGLAIASAFSPPAHRMGSGWLRSHADVSASGRAPLEKKAIQWAAWFARMVRGTVRGMVRRRPLRPLKLGAPARHFRPWPDPVTKTNEASSERGDHRMAVGTFLHVPYDDRWAKLRPVIVKLYLDKGLSLDAVAHRMKAEFQFSAM